MCMSPGRRPLGWKNTEGVGESRGYESSSEVCAVARCGDNPAPLLHQPRKRRLMKLEPLSRRRPMASTGAGNVERDALTAVRLAPARLTQSSTSFEVED